MAQEAGEGHGYNPIIENMNQHQPIDRRAVDFQGMNVAIHCQPDVLDNIERLSRILSSVASTE